MKEDLIDIDEGVPDNQLHYEWPEGRALVKVDEEKELHEFVIYPLDLKISVQLVPFCSLTMVTSGITDGSGLPLRPMMVWVVDITETIQTRGEIRPLTADRITCKDCCFSFLDRACCVGAEIYTCFACWVCCRSKISWDGYWDVHREGNWAKKEEYERDAHSRIPLLIPYEVK